MKCMRASRRAGFTVVEVMIALTILALISVNISMVIRTSTAAYGAGVFQSVLEDQAFQAMDRISIAIMSSSATTTDSVPQAPLSTSSVDYSTVLGYQDGHLVSSDPERIEQLANGGLIQWTKNPGGPNVNSVIWASGVPSILEGETVNGIDDNGNGLIDESGLAFNAVGSKVTIQLTLQRKDQEQKQHQKTLKSVVTCRN